MVLQYHETAHGPWQRDLGDHLVKNGPLRRIDYQMYVVGSVHITEP